MLFHTDPSSSFEYTRQVPSLPLPIPRRATLHSLDKSGQEKKTTASTGLERDETPSPEHPSKWSGKRRRKKGGVTGGTKNQRLRKETPHELTAEEKLEIATALEQQRCVYT